MTGRIVLAVAPGTAERAIDTAFALAAERGSTLLAVRTWHDPDLPLGGWLQPDGTARWDAAHAKARCELDSALEHARATHPAVHVTPIVVDDDLVPFLSALSTRADLQVVSGPAAGQLLEASVKARLVVLGTRARGAAARMVLGSTSRTVLRLSSCAVVVVRRDAVLAESTATPSATPAAQVRGPAPWSLRVQDHGRS
jgi:nucleotide-binding universal stress UspA family protein